MSRSRGLFWLSGTSNSRGPPELECEGLPANGVICDEVDFDEDDGEDVANSCVAT